MLARVSFSIASILLLSFSAQLMAVNTSDKALILDVRERSNTALREQDADALVATMMPDYHVVTSTNQRLSGHDAQRKFMRYIKEHFPDALYQRTTDTIEIAGSGSTAAETGRWQGSWTESGTSVLASGSYFARWQKQDGLWLIQAEVFVRLD